MPLNTYDEIYNSHSQKGSQVVDQEIFQLNTNPIQDKDQWLKTSPRNSNYSNNCKNIEEGWAQWKQKSIPTWMMSQDLNLNSFIYPLSSAEEWTQVIFSNQAIGIDLRQTTSLPPPNNLNEILREEINQEDYGQWRALLNA